LSKNGAEIQGSGSLFSSSNHLSGGGGTADRLTVLSNVEGHPIFAYTAAAPQNKFIKATDLVCACPETLSSRRWGGAVRAEESCGFVLEKRPPDPWIRSI